MNALVQPSVIVLCPEFAPRKMTGSAGSRSRSALRTVKQTETDNPHIDMKKRSLSKWTRSAGVFAALSLSTFLSTPALAALTVAPIFGTNMVLQEGTTVPVFGTATPGATVTVQFANQNVSAVANSNGKWQANLASLSASTSPGSMVVSSGTTSITFTGVQVGEVWLCSGQSNMGKPLSYADGSAPYIADAGNHNIRFFQMVGGNGAATTNWTLST